MNTKSVKIYALPRIIVDGLMENYSFVGGGFQVYTAVKDSHTFYCVALTFIAFLKHWQNKCKKPLFQQLWPPRRERQIRSKDVAVLYRNTGISKR